MINSFNTPARTYEPGMGKAVANRTINRIIDAETGRTLNPDETVAALANGSAYTETWENVAERVAFGNSRLHPIPLEQEAEFHRAHHHLRQASLLMSGRHLQHGDKDQPSRPIEVYTNCSTACARTPLFLLLLSGSGVGTAYDDALMVVNWAEDMPKVICAIDYAHADVAAGRVKANPVNNIEHLYKHKQVFKFVVPDSREGWAQAVEKIETMTFMKKYRDAVLVLDFNQVRPYGAPIKGMQNRPASGPGPLMDAIGNVASLKGSDMPNWRATMYADHYLAECVLVGGARRAARMATKTWRDDTVEDFISVKSGGFLWSSNNSITVDAEFWGLVTKFINTSEDDYHLLTPMAKKALKVFKAVCYHSYYDGTGEPGLINVDQLHANNKAVHKTLADGNYFGNSRYQPSSEMVEMLKAVAAVALSYPNPMITNPCGEISLHLAGGYCVIADVVPSFSRRLADGSFDDADTEDAFRTATRMLIRTNRMEALYGREVTRTNRIGVGMTGFHEYAWLRAGLGFKKLIDESNPASKSFWQLIARFSRAVKDEAERFSAKMGMARPHTDTTIKPAGTTSKLFGLTEGAHLPSMAEYLRWVQFRSDDPNVAQYREMGYPVRDLNTYRGTTIVGFPTQPYICTLGMGDELLTAAEATPEEQYQYLRLLEKYWIQGVTEDGALLADTGNQVSYTLKYNPTKVDYESFQRTLLEGQSSVRCCSVMPQADMSAYEYQPEEPVSAQAFKDIVSKIEIGKLAYQAKIDEARKVAESVAKIKTAALPKNLSVDEVNLMVAEATGQANPPVEMLEEEVGAEHVMCAGGACPIDFKSKTN